eukprot:465403-Amphidinium_carterae.1
MQRSEQHTFHTLQSRRSALRHHCHESHASGIDESNLPASTAFSAPRRAPAATLLALNSATAWTGLADELTGAGGAPGDAARTEIGLPILGIVERQLPLPAVAWRIT